MEAGAKNYFLAEWRRRADYNGAVNDEHKARYHLMRMHGGSQAMVDDEDDLFPLELPSRSIIAALGWTIVGLGAVLAVVLTVMILDGGQ